MCCLNRLLTWLLTCVEAGIYDTMNGSVHDAVVLGLEPETEYRVYVTAYTRRGDGLPSRVKRVRTKGAGLSDE